MSIALTEKKTKELLSEVLVEMIQEKREVFYEIVAEALEDVGLANAIKEGRQNDSVDEAEIQLLLKGDRCR